MGYIHRLRYTPKPPKGKIAAGVRVSKPSKVPFTTFSRMFSIVSEQNVSPSDVTRIITKTLYVEAYCMLTGR